MMVMLQQLIARILSSVIARWITSWITMHAQTLKKGKKPTCVPLDELQREKVEKLIKVGYISLLLDEIPDCGNWGLTINRYIEINYPNDDDILLQKNHYLKEGSITHTAHALRGLSFLKEVPYIIDANAIRSWIKKYTEGPGFLNVPKPANPDEVKGYAKELRHTVAALLALSYMRNIDEDIVSKGEDREWVDQHFETLFNQRKGWVHDHRVTYSHAYLIELLTLMKAKSFRGRFRISRQLVREIKKLFPPDDKTNIFWCASSHPESMFFYSLMIIDHIADTVELYKNKKALNRVLDVLTHLGKSVLPKYNGIPLGISDIERFNKADIYSTATFLRVVWKFQRYRNKEFSTVVNKTMECLLEMVDNLDQYSDNFITHTWEAVLSLTEMFELNESLSAFLREYDPKIDRIRRGLSSGDIIDDSLIQELDNKACSNGVLAKLIQRDVVDNWNVRKAVLG